MATFIIRYLRNLFDVDTTGAVPGDALTLDVDGVTWVPGAGGGGGGAPANATYLVGAADATLTNEIVVGATPGGELGNTWASPTVDTVHSGSSHAQTQAAAEATAAAALLGHTSDPTDAHDASAISFVPVGTISATDVQAAIAEAAAEASDLTGAVILAPASSARNVIQPTAGAVIAAVVKAHAAQSVDLTQWQKSDGTVFGRFTKDGVLKIAPTATGATDVLTDPSMEILARPSTFFGQVTYQGWAVYVPGYDPSWNFGGSAIAARVYDGSPVLEMIKRAPDGHEIGYGALGLQSGFYIDDYDVDTALYTTGFNDMTPAGVRVGGPGSGAYVHRFMSDSTIGLFGVALVSQQSASAISTLWTALKNYGLLDAGSTAPTIGGAPTTATYITQTPDAGLSAEQALSALTTGLVKNTTGTGVLSIGAQGTDYYAPGGTDVAVADGGTGSSTAAGARTNLDVPSNAEAILDAIVDAKGDLIVATAADTVSRLAVGTNTHVLTADSAQATGVKWAAAGGGTTVDVQTFTAGASQTWTKPAGVSAVEVVCIAAGGGGGGGQNGANVTGGSGGGGGAKTQGIFRAADLGATETVNVGAGGAGGIAQGASGGNGGPSNFGAHLKAGGGGGGPGSNGTSNGGGGGSVVASGALTVGGAPTSATAIAGQSGATSSSHGSASEYGGAAGGAATNTAQVGRSGGDSINGGPGGGGGGGNGTPQNGGPGGGVQAYSNGGGAAGGTGGSTGTAGTAGTAGLATKCGTGGGGGGASSGANGGNGGAGGTPGAGGGGAGSGASTTGGTGGVGGDGRVVVISW